MSQGISYPHDIGIIFIFDCIYILFSDETFLSGNGDEDDRSEDSDRPLFPKLLVYSDAICTIDEESELISSIEYAVSNRAVIEYVK